MVGETGQKILRAINDGERNGHKLAASLQGSWRDEYLFALKKALDAFDFCGPQVGQCDAEIDAQLQRLHTHASDPAKGKKRGRGRNAPKFDLRKQLFQMCGVDLTRIDGIDVTTARWPSSARPEST